MNNKSVNIIILLIFFAITICLSIFAYINLEKEAFWSVFPPMITAGASPIAAAFVAYLVSNKQIEEQEKTKRKLLQNEAISFLKLIQLELEHNKEIFNYISTASEKLNDEEKKEHFKNSINTNVWSTVSFQLFQSIDYETLKDIQSLYYDISRLQVHDYNSAFFTKTFRELATMTGSLEEKIKNPSSIFKEN